MSIRGGELISASFGASSYQLHLARAHNSFIWRQLTSALFGARGIPNNCFRYNQLLGFMMKRFDDPAEPLRTNISAKISEGKLKELGEDLFGYS
jgi:hypothetical protein